MIAAKTVLAHTERILSSSLFSRSSVLPRLLTFLVESTLAGKAQELKEYRLGVEVFERGPGFDPRIDPIVRVQAAKLRARLAEYYAGEGRHDTLVISIPRGTYIPVFTPKDAPDDAGKAPAAPASIAVLPFVSVSGDVDNEYFCDGLTEELIHALTYMPGWRVAARTSVFAFKNAAKDVREIGAQLGVRTVLEGSVRKAGSQVRATAQWIEVATGYHLLSRTYLRELKDVFALQEELASVVVTEIMAWRQRENGSIEGGAKLSTASYSVPSGVLPHSALGEQHDFTERNEDIGPTQRCYLPN